MIQKQNYISLEKRKVFDTPKQTNHPKTSQTTFGFGSVRKTNNPKLAHQISGRDTSNFRLVFHHEVSALQQGVKAKCPSPNRTQPNSCHLYPNGALD